jgi:hypothetical protein
MPQHLLTPTVITMVVKPLLHPLTPTITTMVMKPLQVTITMATTTTTATMVQPQWQPQSPCCSPQSTLCDQICSDH